MKKTLQSILFLLILVTLSWIWSCFQQPSGPVYQKNGKEYGKISGYVFRHRWWNYYERGLSFMEGEFNQEALADFTEAIKQRSEDQRMARTYGMHFIDYFPHREIGIVHFLMGNLEAAKDELELSLSQFPSAKARFYLDRVRKALIEREAKEVTPPRLTLSFQTDEVWTREDPVILSGVAEDEHYVASISIDAVPIFLEGSQKRIPFKKSLKLSQGRHAIHVVAKNLPGMVAKHRVIIHVDREGPIIILDELDSEQALQAREVTLNGSLYDEAGIAKLSINGQSIAVEKGEEVRFTAKLIIDENHLKLVAQDRLGNETSAVIPLTSPAASHTPILLAYLGSDAQGFLVAGLFGSKDTRPPSIELKGWTDNQTVFLEKVYIEGQVSDESNIASLTINQIPLLPRKGRILFFSHFAELKEGENTITIEAKDETSNRASKKITVIRRVPRALQLAERLSLTVFPFEKKGEVADASLAFQDNLIDALVNRNRFRVVERDKLDVILEEQKLSRIKLFDNRTAIKLGRLVAAQSLISGSIIETRTGIEVVGRLIDTETSEILATEDVYDEVKDLLGLRSLAEGMAIKFHRDFPLVDGLIVEYKGKHIFTDLGKDAIKLQRRLIVFREEPMKHPLTGKVIGADNIIMGRARVTQVMSEMSKAELLNGKTETIKRLDRVITE
jgi:TolB-like protein/tetratricopeptide (TPR) repeat protein